MKKILILNVLFAFYCSCNAQSEKFYKFTESYKKEIKLPAVASELDNLVVVDNAILNNLLFDKQEDKPKFYSYGGKLVNVTTYGKIPQEPMRWRTWADESQTRRIEKSFDTKTYALGKIDLNEKYHIWATKVVSFQTTYIDLYVFDKNGKLKSLVNLYEAEYESIGEPSNVANVYITSTITKDGTIKWEENRFNVKTSREYQLQSDGYFKVVKQESEGEYEP